jgi:hypothetical protein
MAADRANTPAWSIEGEARVKKNGLLELVETKESLESIGGLDV